MIGRSIGSYRVVAKIGEGGMATVWVARHTLLGRDVALKILKKQLAADAHSRRRFLDEARLASVLDHPNIASVLDAGEDGDDLFIAFDLIQGDTLSALAERAPLQVSEAVRMGIAIGEALGAVHRAGLVHRDVTGRNVMLNRDGRFMLLDFGLALSDRSTRLTGSGIVLGTRAYLSPEVISQQRAVPASDIWGLGVVMFEALTGRLPFMAGDPSAVLYAIANTRAPAPSAHRDGLPEVLDAIVRRTLERNPDDRYRSAEDLVAALRALDLRDDATAVPAVPATGSGASEEAVTEPILPLPLPEYGRRFLAVLPFREMDAAPGRPDHFIAGLAEALSAKLAREHDLHVIPPSAAPADFAARSDRDLARFLRANLLIRSDLRRQGPQLRFSHAIIDPLRGLTLGSGTVEGSMAHLFNFEDDLVASVRAALGLDREMRTSGGRSGAADPVAHERYLQALGYLQREENEAMVDGAKSLLEDLASAETASAEVHAALGRAYLSKYRLTFEPRWEKRAVQSCLQAMELAPGSAEVLLTLGNVHLSAGHWSDAIRDFEGSLAIRPGSAQAHVGTGQALEALGRVSEAEESYRTAMALRPDDWLPVNRLGALLVRAGRYTEAIGAWKKVVELTPDNARGYSNLAGTYFHLDRLDLALPLYRRSIEIQPGATALSNLGTTLYLLAGECFGTPRAEELLAESVALLERACSLRPADARLWGNLGSACRFVRGRGAMFREALDRAISLIRERLARNADDAGDWSQLAGWLANLERHGEAREAIERALSLAPNDAGTLANACVVCHQAGRRREALQWLKRALEKGYSSTKLMRDPYLSGLREDEAFGRIMEETAAARKR